MEIALPFEIVLFLDEIVIALNGIRYILESYKGFNSFRFDDAINFKNFGEVNLRIDETALFKKLIKLDDKEIGY
jgi:hypothetical protein